MTLKPDPGCCVCWVWNDIFVNTNPLVVPISLGCVSLFLVLVHSCLDFFERTFFCSLLLFKFSPFVTLDRSMVR